MSIPDLVQRGAQIKALIKENQSSLKEIEAQLIANGAGSYEGLEGAKCTVVEPRPKFAPDAESIEEARELLGDDNFKKCFVRSVVYAPVKAVRHIAAAVLPPGKLKRLLDICEKPSTPFVLWP